MSKVEESFNKAVEQYGGALDRLAKSDMFRFETGISENNLKHWGELHAVKEFLQNAVYAKTVLGDEITIRYDKEAGKAFISNSPSGFTKGKLLIGESEQADVAGAPGQYGEGMKVAMAVSRRLGLECTVHTNGFTVKPELEPSSLDPSVKALVFYIEDNNRTIGTSFVVQCSEEILEEAKTYFAVLQGLEPERTKEDTILTDFTGIFANGVRITDTSALYGYNFTNADLINRDRSTVDMNKLKESTRGLLSALEDEEIITEIAKGITEDDSLLESQAGIHYTTTTKGTHIWKKVIQKLFGTKIALATGTDTDTKARYKKFRVLTNLPRVWEYFFENSLDIHFTNELRETTISTNVHKKATAEENKNLGWAKRLVKLYYGDYGTVRVSETVTDEHSNPCLGLYDHKTDTTWIKRELLMNKEQLFKTLLHETIHRITGATDNTEAFTRGWEDATWGILTKGKGHM